MYVPPQAEDRTAISLFCEPDEQTVCPVLPIFAAGGKNPLRKAGRTVTL